MGGSSSKELAFELARFKAEPADLAFLANAAVFLIFPWSEGGERIIGGVAATEDVGVVSRGVVCGVVGRVVDRGVVADGVIHWLDRRAVLLEIS